MEQMEMSLLDWIDIISSQDSDSYIRTLPTPTIFKILQGVANALEYIHGKGLLYRDVKTGNVLLSFKAGSDVTVKLSDFGTTMHPPKRGSYPG
jgi:serine/threonine protein kinase